jgi:L-aspartate oxidase
VQDSTDFLVIGSGIAGLRAAADLATHGTVLILTKADPAESNTGYAQGGIAVALGADDSPSLHAADTMAAGDGLCDAAAVQTLVEDGVRYVRELVEWGARFDRSADGELAVGREAAHSVRRVLHAHDATGREIGRALWERVSAHPNVRVLNHTRATGLLIDGGRCVGAQFVGSAGAGTVSARATLIATGGGGQVFRETTNPSVATG